MEHDDTSQFEGLIDRLRQGDEAARDELLARAYQRLCSLTGTLLQSFPDLKAAHDTESVLHDALGDLRRAIETVQPPTAADFFRLAAHKIRQTLLDLATKDRRRSEREGDRFVESSDSTVPGVAAPRMSEAAVSTSAPEILARWTELHDRVNQLPHDELEVFRLHYYVGLKQAEIASLLGDSARKVSHLWVRATERLAESLDLQDGCFP